MRRALRPSLLLLAIPVVHPFLYAGSLELKSGSHLYGRGIAKQKSGDGASAAADVAAAKTLDQGIEGKFKRYGVTPGTSPTPTTPGTGR